MTSYFVPRRAPLRVLTRSLAERALDSQVWVCVSVLGTAEPAAVVREEENGANVVEIEYNAGDTQPLARHETVLTVNVHEDTKIDSSPPRWIYSFALHLSKLADRKSVV